MGTDHAANGALLVGPGLALTGAGCGGGGGDDVVDSSVVLSMLGASTLRVEHPDETL